MKISMSQGISGWFDVDGLIISFWASSWTGREIVRVEDEEGARIVSNRRSFKFTTPHEFTVGSDQYRLEAQINFARVELRLFRNAALVDSDQFNPSKKQIRIDPETGKVDWTYILKKTVVPILFGLTVGVVFGFTAGSVVKWWLA
ncbi:MAG: hypothetical protein AAGJ52_07630 [Pseudomonadota bacterium]